jgi:putative transposase
MFAARYLWRQLNQEQREELLKWRKERGYPWHSPPHRPNFGHLRFLIPQLATNTVITFGQSPERMDSFSCGLLAALAMHASQTFAWCVLPNHYHALVETSQKRNSKVFG